MAREDEMEPGKETTGPPAWFFGGLLVGAVLLGLVWGTVAYLTEDDTPAGASSQARVALASPSSSGRTSSTGPSSPAEPSPTGPTLLERCVQAATALESPIDAAGPALDQWAVHVGAMNKLVVGAITLQQATAFWNQTRFAAQQHIAHFDHALAQMRRDAADCPAPGSASGGPKVLRPCVRTVAAETAVVQAARAAIDTWDKHVREMDMLRMGRLSPTKATQMWLAMWQEGVRQIDSYRTAVRAAAGAPGCPDVERPGSLQEAPGGMPSDMSGM
jgi:hypothetical protein